MLSGCFVASNTGTLHKSDGIMDYLKIQHQLYLTSMVKTWTQLDVPTGQ